MVVKFRRRKRQTEPNLNDLSQEPYQLVPIWLIILPMEPCHTGGVCLVEKLKKDWAKPNPNNSSSGNLSMGPNVINAIGTPLRRWLHQRATA